MREITAIAIWGRFKSVVLLLALGLFFGGHAAAEESKAVAMKVPVAFFVELPARSIPGEVVLPVHPVKAKSMDEAMKESKVVARAYEGLMALREGDREKLGKIVRGGSAEEVLEVLSYLGKKFFAGNGKPVILGYTKGKGETAVWLTKADDMSVLYPMVLQGEEADAKWMVLRENNQFDIMQLFLQAGMLAGALRSEDAKPVEGDETFDLLGQLSVADGLKKVEPLVAELKLTRAAQIKPWAVYAAGNITVLVGEDLGGEPSMYYFEKTGGAEKLAISKNGDPLGMFVLEKYLAAKKVP